MQYRAVQKYIVSSLMWYRQFYHIVLSTDNCFKFSFNTTVHCFYLSIGVSQAQLIFFLIMGKKLTHKHNMSLTCLCGINTAVNQDLIQCLVCFCHFYVLSQWCQWFDNFCTCIQQNTVDTLFLHIYNHGIQALKQIKEHLKLSLIHI